MIQISSCLFQPRWLYYTEFTFTRTLVLGFILYSHHYMGRGSETDRNPPPLLLNAVCCLTNSDFNFLYFMASGCGFKCIEWKERIKYLFNGSWKYFSIYQDCFLTVFKLFKKNQYNPLSVSTYNEQEYKCPVSSWITR